MRNEEIVTFETFEVIGKTIYAEMAEKNILFKLDMDENKVELINKDIGYRFRHCAHLNNKIYFADHRGYALVEYDIVRDAFTAYKMDAHMRASYNIAAVEAGGGNVFVVSALKGMLYIFDPEYKTLEQEKRFAALIRELYGEKAECDIRCRKIDEYLYLIVNKGSDYNVCKYNMAEKRIEDISKAAFCSDIRATCCFGQKLYVLLDDFALRIWDVKSNDAQTFDMEHLRQLMDGIKPKHGYAFSALAVTKKNVWLLPAGDNEDIYIYDIRKKTAQKYGEYPLDFKYRYRESWSKHGDIKERGDFIYVGARTSNYYLMIDAETGEGHWKQVGRYDFSEYYRHMIIEKCGNGQAVYEESQSMLEMFMDYSRKKECSFRDNINNGSRIWEALK